MAGKILAEEKCDHNTFQRLKFFHGMLLDDKDFKDEQQYHVEKRKLHNRMLHGWGVVCGLNIEDGENRCQFIVKPGMALDCHGNEIVVCKEVTVDLADPSCLSSEQGRRKPRRDPCSQEGQGGGLYTGYIGIRYNETQTSLVPVYTADDECGKQECANSRIKEGFCIDILNECPDDKLSAPIIHSRQLLCIHELFFKAYFGQEKDPNEFWKFCKQIEEKMDAFCQAPLRCPECCPTPHYVGLGKIEFNENNEIIKIYDECRQYIIGNQFILNTLFGLWCFMYRIMRENMKSRDEIERRLNEVEESLKLTVAEKPESQQDQKHQGKRKTRKSESSDEEK